MQCIIQCKKNDKTSYVKMEGRVAKLTPFENQATLINSMNYAKNIRDDFLEKQDFATIFKV